MWTPRVILLLITAFTLAASGAPSAASSTATTGVTPVFKHIGKLAFGPDGVMFAADGHEVSITALQLGEQMAGGVPSTKDVPAIDQKIAALLGIDVANLLITDMVVDPKTRNTYISVMRGVGASAEPVLLRVDGASHARGHLTGGGPLFADRGAQPAPSRDTAGARGRTIDSREQLP